ncbi:MAG: hypothetical protein H0Z28_11080 [Archaeoglobus sp.]|nr:hypothetical protein [Archaeoglobus sp.]
MSEIKVLTDEEYGLARIDKFKEVDEVFGKVIKEDDYLDENQIENAGIYCKNLEDIREIAGAIKSLVITGNFNRILRILLFKKVLDEYNKGEISPQLKSYAPTFKKFCEKVGISYRTANYDIKMLSEFGLEFLRRIENIGFGFRELRQALRFSGDKREKLVQYVLSPEATNEGIRELIRELLEENEELKRAGMEDKAKILAEIQKERARAKRLEENVKELKREKKNLCKQLEKASPEAQADMLIQDLRSLVSKYEYLSRQYGDNEDVQIRLEEFRQEVLDLINRIK